MHLSIGWRKVVVGMASTWSPILWGRGPDRVGPLLRTEMSRDLDASGTVLPELRQARRWQYPTMAIRYTRHQTADKNAVAAPPPKSLKSGLVVSVRF